MHDSSGVPPALQYLIYFGVIGLLGYIQEKTRLVPRASNLKSLRDPPRRTVMEATVQARHAEIVRLAYSNLPTIVPGLIRSELEDRAILSMPVVLHECRRPRRTLSSARLARRTMIWPHRARGRTASRPIVDHGTLYLTRDEFMFASATRRRRYSLDELTHLSSTASGIAVATRGSGALSFFGGIDNTTIRFSVEPGPGEYWPGIVFELRFTGYEVEEIVHILLSSSTLAST